MLKSQKQFVFGLFLTSFVIISLFLYSNLDSVRVTDNTIKQSVEVESLRNVIQDLNVQLKQNKEAMAKIQTDLEKEEAELEKRKSIVHENVVYDEKNEADEDQKQKLDNLRGKPDDKADFEEKEDQIKHGGKVAAVQKHFQEKQEDHQKNLAGTCSLANYSKTNADVQMLDVYQTLKFDNIDGGVWKQGWEITYDTAKVSQEPPLQVIVIPHSHCDPGWIKTFDQYYQDQTVHILSGMAKHLGEKPDMRFIYAEMSFFETWWRQQTEATRKKVKEYLDKGSFEIVTGGWVMTDEANTHYFSIITELFEGHEWLRNHLDYRPKAHWSIDPFGLSPSLPLLLSAANITHAALQRIHYSVKKHLAKNKQLEFMWRQMWGAKGQKDVRTHVFPFYSYDVPHTCGPEPAICCQFDFKRLPGNGDNCPWNIPPQEINAGNVAERAFKLYDQYRKKSQLYDTNVLLIPLGDDFRYAGDVEWEAQHRNYKKLFAHMNAKKEWNVHAKFGTLSDYFTLLEAELAKEKRNLPIFTGDFFTYADRDDHYWSGYFTSRPFYKQMDRVLQHYLRSAEIAFSLASMNGFKNDAIYSSLVSARRHHSLFQHHDGVTGTAKDHVVQDYGSKMLAALDRCESVLAASIEHLLDSRQLDLKMSETRQEHDVLAKKKIFTAESNFVVFNTLSRKRTEPVCVIVGSQTLRVKGDYKQQISPVFELKDGRFISTEKFELCFVKEVEAFGTEVFELIEGEGAQKTTISSNDLISGSSLEISPIEKEIILDNNIITAKFDSTSGFLKTITPKEKTETEINLHFIRYGARPHKPLNNGGGDSLSGAYLFLPDDEARKIPNDNHHIVVVNGPIVKRVYVAGSKDLKMLQMYTLSEGSNDVEIETEVDIRGMKENYELAMRIDTSVKSGDDLYTDLNGMQMIRRVRMLKKLPLQAHYYPMPGSAYIEDAAVRVNMLGAQALGVASLKEGQLEVMLDRRLYQDDDRGLFQGVMDNKRTLSRFRLLVEPMSGGNNDPDVRVGFLSTAAHSSSLELHYPWVKMNTGAAVAAKSSSGLGISLPCDVHVVNLRTLAKPTDYENKPGVVEATNEAALILHRTLPDCRSQMNIKSKCREAKDTITIKELLPKVTKSIGATLTLMYEDSSPLESVTVEPQQVRSVKLQW